MDEVIARFGGETIQRIAVTDRLRRIFHLAGATGALDRLIIFGSYVTNKADPNDVDVVLVMKDDFVSEQCTPETRPLFDHARSGVEFGASIFWIRPGALIWDTLDSFLQRWQTTRDGTRRGIVEVKS